MLDLVLDLVGDRRLAFALLVIGTLGVAFVVERTVLRVLTRLAARTETQLDDLIVAALQRPVFTSAVLVGLAYARGCLHLSDAELEVSTALLQTFALLLWTIALLRISGALLRATSARAGEGAIVQSRTLPLFEILVKLAIVGGSVYLGMLAWGVDIGAWAASAGIVGLAFGLAMQDSLANLFAGLSIVADAPFKLGDFVQLEDGLRGKVTHIGIRSTRILTRNDVEVNVPNAVIGNAKILNETGGPYTKERIAAVVSVAYGTDLNRARAALLSTVTDHPDIADHPEAEIHFDTFGASGIDCAVRVWIHDPAMRDRVISDLNFRIYKALAAAEIEIPYTKHDVYVEELVGVLRKGSRSGLVDHPPTGGA